MATYHKVKPGEYLNSIAQQYGFVDPGLIWTHSKNKALAKKRSSPNILYPGDILYIPDKDEKKEPRSTDAKHVFNVPKLGNLLQIIAQDAEGKPLANQRYELALDNGQIRPGSTTDDGLVKEPLPLSVRTATLLFDKYEWPLEIATLHPLTETIDSGITGMQARLRNLGYDPGPIDGIVGPRTTAALIAFQADNSPLVVDGIYGPQTRAKLLEKHGC